jgi:hypothetical protein
MVNKIYKAVALDGYGDFQHLIDFATSHKKNGIEGMYYIFEGSQAKLEKARSDIGSLAEGHPMRIPGKSLFINSEDAKEIKGVIESQSASGEKVEELEGELVMGGGAIGAAVDKDRVIELYSGDAVIYSVSTPHDITTNADGFNPLKISSSRIIHIMAPEIGATMFKRCRNEPPFMYKMGCDGEGVFMRGPKEYVFSEWVADLSQDEKELFNRLLGIGGLSDRAIEDFKKNNILIPFYIRGSTTGLSNMYIEPANFLHKCKAIFGNLSDDLRQDRKVILLLTGDGITEYYLTLDTDLPSWLEVIKLEGKYVGHEKIFPLCELEIFGCSGDKSFEKALNYGFFPIFQIALSNKLGHYKKFGEYIVECLEKEGIEKGGLVELVEYFSAMVNDSPAPILTQEMLLMWRDSVLPKVRERFDFDRAIIQMHEKGDLLFELYYGREDVSEVIKKFPMCEIIEIYRSELLLGRNTMRDNTTLYSHQRTSTSQYLCDQIEQYVISDHVLLKEYVNEITKNIESLRPQSTHCIDYDKEILGMLQKRVALLRDQVSALEAKVGGLQESGCGYDSQSQWLGIYKMQLRTALLQENTHLNAACSRETEMKRKWDFKPDVFAPMKQNRDYVDNIVQQASARVSEVRAGEADQRQGVGKELVVDAAAGENESQESPVLLPLTAQDQDMGGMAMTTVIADRGALARTLPGEVASVEPVKGLTEVQNDLDGKPI